MSSRRQQAIPLIVAGTDQGRSVSPLEPLRLEPTDEEAGRYDEAWLQHLIHDHPELLPITEIEPAFVPIIPVCLELSTPKGFIDNFFVTPTGNLVFAECKLWRSPEARRQVVAQVMDYIDGLTSWGYEDLEKAVCRAASYGDSQTQGRLYDFVKAENELEESEFTDAVSRNLRLGRGLFLIIGDGIREEAESLTLYVQAHAGLHFALGLVELAMFRLPNGTDVLVQPRVITRTINIERGIVRIDDARISIEPPKETDSKRPKTLSEEEFYDAIVKGRETEFPDRLRAFLQRIEPLGVKQEFKRTLTLRWYAIDGTVLNLATIYTSGETDTSNVNSAAARQLGLLDITHAYVRELAEAIHGEVRHAEKDKDICYVWLDGHNPRIEKLLEHEDAWVQVIERLATQVNEKLEEGDV